MGWRTTCLVLLPLVAMAISLLVGRYPVDFNAMLGVLFGNVPFVNTHFTAVDQTVLTTIRLPRIWCGVLVGAGLAAAGTGYQTMFRNPLVSPDILGVSAGAGFGGAVALLLHLPYWQLNLTAFAGGLTAAAISMGIGRSIGREIGRAHV